MTPVRLATLLVLAGLVGWCAIAVGVGMIYGAGFGLIVAGMPFAVAGFFGLLLVNVDVKARR